MNRELDKRKEEISKLEEELEKTRREHNTYVVDIKRASKDRFNELQPKNNSLQDELHNERAVNATITRRISMLEKQCEDGTTRVASFAFSKFSQ